MSDLSVWTPARVRSVLPEVPVRLASGKIVPGFVRGRKLDFAAVKLDGELRGLEFSCAWDTIAHVLNSRTAIRL